MPSLIDVRRRIRSVKNMQQITKAMKMVAASKLRRAQDRVVAARPYSRLLNRMLGNVAHAAAEEDGGAHPLLARREEKRILLVLVTTDRGSVGAFNSNLLRHAQRFIAERPAVRLEMELMGRKGRDFFRKRGAIVAGEYITLFLKTVRGEDAGEIARKISLRYAENEIDAVYLMGNRFKSVATQEMSTERILPVAPPAAGSPVYYIYEQPPAAMLAGLLPLYVEAKIRQAMLESSAAEQAARMSAMDAASSNAADVLERLTLNMNRIRQASITREIIEIVSGASALG